MSEAFEDNPLLSDQFRARVNSLASKRRLRLSDRMLLSRRARKETQRLEEEGAGHFGAVVRGVNEAVKKCTRDFDL